MESGIFSIRRMNRSEIDLAIDWAEKEGWNPGNHDAECFYTTDPKGFFLGFLGNDPVAMVSAVAYGDSYGFMGFYMVKPEIRDGGYGVQLWEAGLEYLGNRNIGLDSVRPDLVSRKKPEFQPAYTNFRFRWVKDEEWDLSPDIVQLADIPFPIIAEYDLRMFAFSRQHFLKCWISRPGTVALGIMTGSKVSGYGVLRECREGFKIGPLFADNKDLAMTLFQALTNGVEMGTPIFLDTPERNADSVILAQSYGMTEVFRTARMYNQGEPTLPLNNWYGVTTFELG